MYKIVFFGLALLFLYIQLRSPALNPPTATPYTAEQYRDLARQAVELCRLPQGDRNRPSKQICGY